jgi:hypothetical protein
MTDHGRRNLPKSLSMAFWNANGLSGKIEELKLFASCYSLDVILVSETKLRDHNRDPKIPGYQIHRRDRPYGPCGAVAIYVRKPLKHSLAATPDIQHLEATGIRIETVNGPLRLFSCYNRPRSRLIDGELLAIINDGLPVIAAKTRVGTAAQQTRTEESFWSSLPTTTQQSLHRSNRPTITP